MKAQAPDADSDLEARTMHVFVTRALQTILKDAPKKHAELRKACTSVIGALRTSFIFRCRRACVCTQCSLFLPRPDWPA